MNSRFYGSVILFFQNPFDLGILNLDVDGHNVISVSAMCYNEKQKIIDLIFLKYILIV